MDATFSSRQKDVYHVVLDAHLAAVAAVTPGRPFRGIYLLACRTLAEGLKGLGHLLGLDVQDMENLGEVWAGCEGQPKSTQLGLKSLRLARPLEPGLYFIPEIMRRWKIEGRFLDVICYDQLEQFADFGGARIDENLVVTPAVHRILGKTRPRTVAEVAAVRRGIS